MMDGFLIGGFILFFIHSFMFVVAIFDFPKFWIDVKRTLLLGCNNNQMNTPPRGNERNPSGMYHHNSFIQLQRASSCMMVVGGWWLEFA
jgi:hypothetical protein